MSSVPRAIPLILLLLVLFTPVRAAIITVTGAGGDIPDGGSATFEIVVTDPSIIRPIGNNVTVVLYGLQHEFIGDLTATLTFQEPQVTADLFVRVGKDPDVADPGDPAFFGYPSNLNGTYTFNSGFSADFWEAANVGDADLVPPGSYFSSVAGGAVSNLSSAFNGRSAAGHWILTITDSELGGTGRLATGWELQIDVEQVPEPATAGLTAVFSLALIAVARRGGAQSRSEVSSR